MSEAPKIDDYRIPIEHLRCAAHNVTAICVGGTRVTSMKCCGSWDVLARHWVKRRDLVQAIEDHKSQDPEADDG